MCVCVCGCSCCCHFGEHWLWLHGFCFIYSRAAHLRAKKTQTQIDAQAVSRKALEVTLMWICECSAIKLFLFIIIIFHSSETKAFGIYVIMSIDSNIVIVWVRLAVCVICTCFWFCSANHFTDYWITHVNFSTFYRTFIVKFSSHTHTHWQTSGNIIALYRSSLSYFVKCHIYHAPNNRDVLTSNSQQSSLQRRRNAENQNLSALEHQLHSIISFSKLLSMRSSSSFCTSSSSVDLVFRGFQDFQRCVLITRFALSWQPTTCDLISFRF